MIAHIVEYQNAARAVIGFEMVSVAAIGAAMVCLAALHYRVKHRGMHGFLAASMQPVAALVSLGLVVTLVPSVASGNTASDIPEGLPDLVSEPPVPWRALLVEQPDGSLGRMLAFDGFLHNVGPGVLELAGNPQDEGGVTQRWREDGVWQTGGSPLVRYETTDDHNHFHLMAAAEYALWNEARTERISDAAKVGFCLVDTQFVDDRHASLYPIEANQYCEQENPDATYLSMGITPGWVDIYDGNTTLQWVDASDIAPGRYFVSAITDPDDQIIEFDEANNAEVFSETSFALSGWKARPLPTQTAAGAITLKADAIGNVADVEWEIVAGPTNGTLSVPTGVVFSDPNVTYEAEAGFDGVDTFAYVARDRNSGFPLNPAPVTVDIDASSAARRDNSTPDQDTSAVSIVDPEAQATDLIAYDAFEIEFSHTGIEDEDDAGAEALRWYADGLPTGFSIDVETGVVAGVSTIVNSSGTATIVLARGADVVDTHELEWSVQSLEASERAALDDLIALSSPLGDRFNRTVGIVTTDAVYEAEGLPPGIRFVENVPLLTGNPDVAGVYEVTLIERVDGEITDQSSFTWTIRNGTTPAFPL